MDASIIQSHNKGTSNHVSMPTPELRKNTIGYKTNFVCDCIYLWRVGMRYAVYGVFPYSAFDCGLNKLSIAESICTRRNAICPFAYLRKTLWRFDGHYMLYIMTERALMHTNDYDISNEHFILCLWEFSKIMVKIYEKISQSYDNIYIPTVL